MDVLLYRDTQNKNKNKFTFLIRTVTYVLIHISSSSTVGKKSFYESWYIRYLSTKHMSYLKIYIAKLYTFRIISQRGNNECELYLKGEVVMSAY